MVGSDQQQELVRLLLAATRRELLPWEKDAARDLNGGYKMKLGLGSVQIYTTDKIVYCDVLNQYQTVTQTLLETRKSGRDLDVLYQCVDEHFRKDNLAAFTDEVRGRIQKEG